MPQMLLVTGATGSIGRMVVPELLANGFAVRGQYARRPGGDPAVDWRQCDFRETLALDPLVEGCAGIIHLAGELNAADAMQRVNADATAALVAAATRAGVHYFSLASSMVVYGSPRHATIDETTPTIDPSRPLQAQFLEPFTTREYARTKVLAEQAAMAAGEAMAVDILRIAKSADGERFLEALGWSRIKKALQLYGQTHYIDQRDCAHAIVHCARQGLARAPGVEIYNVADERSGTYAKLLAHARRRLGGAGWDDQFHIPLLPEMLKNLLKYRVLSLRLPASAARLRADKLRATGFRFPIGYGRALDQAIDARLATRIQ